MSTPSSTTCCRGGSCSRTAGSSRWAARARKLRPQELPRAVLGLHEPAAVHGAARAERAGAGARVLVPGPRRRDPGPAAGRPELAGDPPRLGPAGRPRRARGRRRALPLDGHRPAAVLRPLPGDAPGAGDGDVSGRALAAGPAPARRGGGRLPWLEGDSTALVRHPSGRSAGGPSPGSAPTGRSVRGSRIWPRGLPAARTCGSACARTRRFMTSRKSLEWAGERVPTR